MASSHKSDVLESLVDNQPHPDDVPNRHDDYSRYPIPTGQHIVRRYIADIRNHDWDVSEDHRTQSGIVKPFQDNVIIWITKLIQPEKAFAQS